MAFKAATLDAFVAGDGMTLNLRCHPAAHVRHTVQRIGCDATGMALATDLHVAFVSPPRRP